ncbi:non-homologous end-joining DNA ligase [Motilibacter peucedani]
MAATKTPVEVDGRRLMLSNLDKVMYPATGFTKGEVIDYYARVAPVLLPHLTGRPATRKRYPDGVEGGDFFEKNAPKHTPDWVRTVTLDSPGSTKGRETIDYVVVEGLATLVWLANLAALELHVPQWTVGPRGGVRGADLVVLDLDPGPPATVVECSEVAQLIRTTLVRPEWGGLEVWAKTSGSKGMQLCVPVATTPWERTHAFARALAEHLERERPDLVVSRMTKALRPGKVLIDWSQNNGSKTTVAPYSLRAREAPTVSTPVTWDEVAACRAPEDLRFTAPDVLARVDELGDLLAPLLERRQRLLDPPAPAQGVR